ncbi:MAG: PIN domain-containing protein [Caldilineales bacterium]|nr:PIN domain-containing protein [Caldilineales bacterium]
MGVDTAPFIYYIEENPTYLARIAPIFLAADAGQITLVTSTITVAEVLIHPLRLGADDLRREYLDLFLNSANLEIQSIDIEVAQRAAELRVTHNVRLPDALQIAAALYAGCTAFLTNDRQLGHVTDLRILIVDELELE